MSSSVLVTRRLPSSVLAKLEAAAAVDLHAAEAAISPGELRARAADKEAIVCLLTDPIGRELMEAAPRLKIVANVAVGYDNIDVAAARDRGIVVTNTPDVLTDSVAVFTWTLILAVTRRLAEGDRLMRRAAWKGWALDFMLGTDLRGKQLGLIGFGRIGRAVAARAPAFGMRVACASSRTTSVMGGASGDRESPGGRGPRSIDAPLVEPMSLDRLLNTSDVVSLHVPLTADTRHLIDRRALARMKRSAYLINTARGPVIDEEALAWALEQHLIAGAALDVYEHEPAVHPGLLGLDTVLLVPHLGSATTETRTAMADLAVENVLAVLGGRPPLTPVR